MIEVVIDSIRVSLMSQQRIVVLKEVHADRYLTIWIGGFEAEAITVELQEIPSPRPMTHDLLRATIEQLGGRLVHILINDLRKDVYYAKLVIDVDGRQVEVDSRPSDAIALAVRANAPIFVAESVMTRAGFEPEDSIEDDDLLDDQPTASENKPVEDIDETKLSAFADFVNSLDLDDLDEDD